MLGFLKRELILCAAVLAAAVSALFVPISPACFSYIDFRVLALLLCLMLTVAGARKAGFFLWITSRFLRRVRNTRMLTLVLSAACFFFSMLITNDVALITLVPLALMTLAADGRTLILSVVMMTIAANLGSMLTPIGNPQNLYLYTAFQLPLGVFFKTMLPPAALSALLVGLSGFLVKRIPLALPQESEKLKWRALLPWAALFLVCLACVARLLDYRVMLAVVLASTLCLDRRLLLQADYSLLATFVAFFIFVGNIKALPQVAQLLQGALVGHEKSASILLSQVISNVPAAMLLSGFCQDPLALLVGVNLGGLGTPIASMASLISYKQYALLPEAQRGRYMAIFMVLNISLLAILWCLSTL